MVLEIRHGSYTNIFMIKENNMKELMKELGVENHYHLAMYLDSIGYKVDINDIPKLNHEIETFLYSVQ